MITQFHILLTAILVLEMVAGAWVFVFYFIPEARHLAGRLGPKEVMKKAIVRYRDDADLRDMIDAIQKEVTQQLIRSKTIVAMFTANMLPTLLQRYCTKVRAI